jgi:hypothetical protein
MFVLLLVPDGGDTDIVPHARGSHKWYSSRPVYAPDFSKIEETFSMVKSFLRCTGARTREALEEAIADGDCPEGSCLFPSL